MLRSEKELLQQIIVRATLRMGKEGMEGKKEGGKREEGRYRRKGREVRVRLRAGNVFVVIVLESKQGSAE